MSSTNPVIQTPGVALKKDTFYMPSTLSHLFLKQYVQLIIPTAYQVPISTNYQLPKPWDLTCIEFYPPASDVLDGAPPITNFKPVVLNSFTNLDAVPLEAVYQYFKSPMLERNCETNYVRGLLKKAFEAHYKYQDNYGVWLLTMEVFNGQKDEIK
jgi:hypothetical protein